MFICICYQPTNQPNTQAELDEIDIELDELLDMDDDEKRRHWLKVSVAS